MDEKNERFYSEESFHFLGDMMIKRIVAAMCTPIMLTMPQLKASADKAEPQYYATSQEMTKNQEKIILLLQKVVEELNIVQKNIGQYDLKTELALDTIWSMLEQIQDFQLSRPESQLLHIESMWNRGLLTQKEYDEQIYLLTQKTEN